jgi:hypothetical protein
MVNLRGHRTTGRSNSGRLLKVSIARPASSLCSNQQPRPFAVKKRRELGQSFLASPFAALLLIDPRVSGAKSHAAKDRKQ